jgi:hypothetical protein
LSSPPRSDRFWGPFDLPTNGYWGLLPQRMESQDDHSSDPVLRLKMSGAVPVSPPILIHDVILNKVIDNFLRMIC